MVNQKRRKMLAIVTTIAVMSMNPYVTTNGVPTIVPEDTVAAHFRNLESEKQSTKRKKRYLS
jgi:hypothetical protein